MIIYKNASIKKVVKLVFNLKDADYKVLGTIARLGYLNKNQIYDNLANSTLRQVRWRIDKILLPGKFLFVEEEKPYHNIKKAFKTKESKGYKLTETKYGLTFKGFLASLGFCPLKETYLIKEYLTWLIPKIEDDALEHIQRHVILYFWTMMYRGIKLNSIAFHTEHIRETRLDILRIGVSNKELTDFVNLLIEFDSLESKIKNKTPNSKQKDEMFIIVENWYEMIPSIIGKMSRFETLDGWDAYMEFIKSLPSK